MMTFINHQPKTITETKKMVILWNLERKEMFKIPGLSGKYPENTETFCQVMSICYLSKPKALAFLWIKTHKTCRNIENHIPYSISARANIIMATKIVKSVIFYLKLHIVLIYTVLYLFIHFFLFSTLLAHLEV
jgi:hypothetical protein